MGCKNQFKSPKFFIKDWFAYVFKGLKNVITAVYNSSEPAICLASGQVGYV
jgi:hypothetical protein